MTELLLGAVGFLVLLSAAMLWGLMTQSYQLAELKQAVAGIRIPPAPDLSALSRIERQANVLLEIASAEPPPAEDGSAPTEAQEAMEAMSRRVALLVPMVRALYDKANAPAPRMPIVAPVAREKPMRQAWQSVRDAQKARGHN